MLKHLLSFACSLLTASLFAQTPPPQYLALVKTGDSLYYAKQYKASAGVYSQAFAAFGGKGMANDRYSAAQVWSLTGYPDSAFYNLNRIVDKAAYADYRQVFNEPDFKSLHTDARWEPLLLKIKANKDKKEEKYDRALLYLLDSLVVEEQKWRHYITDFETGKLGVKDTISLKAANRYAFLSDSLNYYHLKNIFAKHGFPNYDLIGTEGARNFWLLVQHQDKHPEFQREILTAMKVQVDSGKASVTDYAYLVDRVQINAKLPQVYGTQMMLNDARTSYTPQPVIEPAKLNERRKTVKLEPIEDYIAFMNRNYLSGVKK